MKEDFTKNEINYLKSLSQRLRRLFFLFLLLIIIGVFFFVSDFYYAYVAAQHLKIHGVGEMTNTVFGMNNYEGTYSGYYILLHKHFYKGMQELILVIILVLFYFKWRRNIIITQKLWNRTKYYPNSNSDQVALRKLPK